MQMIGFDLHSRQQTLAILDTETGVLEERVLEHDGNKVRDFYASLPRPARVGIEATGSMHWFLQLMEELEIECQVGHPARIRAAEPRKQKHDRRDALLLLRLLREDRFPAIWMPSLEQRDVRALLTYRHQWVRIRVRVQNALQSIALSQGLRRGTSLWSKSGLHSIRSLRLPQRQSLGRLTKQGSPMLRFLWCEAVGHARTRPNAAMRWCGSTCSCSSSNSPWGEADSLFRATVTAEAGPRYRSGISAWDIRN